MKQTIIKLLLIIGVSSLMMASELTRTEKLSLIKDIITLGDVVDEKLNSSNFMKELEGTNYVMKKYDNKKYTLSYKIVTNSSKDIFAIFKFLNLKDPNSSLVTKYHIKKNDVLLISKANKKNSKVVYIGSATGKASTSTETNVKVNLDQKVDSFVRDTKGKSINMDNAYGAQCMDLMHSYVEDVLKIPREVKKDKKVIFKSPLVAGGPDAIYNKIFKNIDSKELSYGSRKVRLDKIPNTVKSIPQKGDIIIWKGAPINGNYGHVAIFIDGDVNSFKSLDQNWIGANSTVGSPAAIITHSYNGVLGYLRPTILSE